jgi:hypothetical protein
MEASHFVYLGITLFPKQVPNGHLLTPSIEYTIRINLIASLKTQS